MFSQAFPTVSVQTSLEICNAQLNKRCGSLENRQEEDSFTTFSEMTASTLLYIDPEAFSG